MRKMNVKKMLVATLSLATLGVAASGIVAIAPVGEGVVASAASVKPTPETFEMVQGASVRTVADAGIRFSTYLNKAWIDGQIAEGKTVEVGTLVIPASKLTDTTDDNFHVGTQDVLTYTHEKATAWLVDGDYYKVNAVLSKIPDAELATKIAAKSYVKIDGTVYGYADAQVRSIAQVASFAIAEGNDAEYLDTVLDKTVTDISITYENPQEGVQGFRLVEGEEKAVSVDGTFVSGLKETPNLNEYAIAWETSDETAVTVENGKVTSLGGEATITAKLGEKTASTDVRLSVKVEEKTFDESKFHSSSGDTLFKGVYMNARTPEKYEDNLTYIKEGDSSWKVEMVDTGTKKYAGLAFNWDNGYESNLDTIFADGTVSSFTFDVYNAHTADIAYCIGYLVYGGTGYENSGVKRVEGTLTAGAWTTVTITREAFEGIVTDLGSKNHDGDIVFACNDNPAATLYFDNIVMVSSAKQDSGMEGKCYVAGASNSLVSALYAATATLERDNNFVKEGYSSWQWNVEAFSANRQGIAAFGFVVGKEGNFFNIDDIFADSNVNSFSFDIYNSLDVDVTYQIGADVYLTNLKRAEGTLTAGEWTTVTITRAVYEQVMADKDGKNYDFMFSLVEMSKTGALYIDNFVID